MRLYRPVKNQLRRRLEAFSWRIQYLPDCERELLSVFMAGISFSQIARIAGVAPATVARRIARIVHRLSGANYIFALRRNERFKTQQMEILRLYFIRGMTMSQIAVQCGRSRTYVAKTVRMLEKTIKKENPEYQDSL